jgi:hypothetical protein
MRPPPEVDRRRAVQQEQEEDEDMLHPNEWSVDGRDRRSAPWTSKNAPNPHDRIARSRNTDDQPRASAKGASGHRSAPSVFRHRAQFAAQR